MFFDPFCPKAVTLIGERLPQALRTRCIIIKLWPKKIDDKIETFSLIGDDECSVLRRKLARWSKDNAAGLEVAQPSLPERFNNRVVCNWQLLLAIAEPFPVARIGRSAVAMLPSALTELGRSRLGSSYCFRAWHDPKINGNAKFVYSKTWSPS